MKDTYISLGAACDTAMILKKYNLRKKSYPFDWLWNLDTGLDSITNIIKTDFAKISNEDSYSEELHYRFPNNVVVYKYYPSIVHLHTNPLQNKKEHCKLERRIKRFREELTSNRKKHFVYHCNHNEERRKKYKNNLKLSINKLVSQGKRFMKVMSIKYPRQKNNIDLLLIFQCPEDKKNETNEYINTISKTLKSNNIYIGHTIPRNDNSEEELKLWSKQWHDIIFNYPGMPANLRFRKNIENATMHMLLKIKTKIKRS